MNHTTDNLLATLLTTDPTEMENMLSDSADKMVSGEHPFSVLFKELIRQHGKTQLNVIRKAGFTDKYGYRLISEECHTRQRDFIIRLCLAAELTLEETQRILRLYGMAPLYARIPRDAVIISAITHGIYETADINALLVQNKLVEISFYAE